MEGGQPDPRTRPDICPTCGQVVTVQRWGLSSVEAWGRSHRQMGFLSVSPGGWPSDHPRMPYVNAARDELFALSVPCVACFSYGVADDWSGGWRDCPYC